MNPTKILQQNPPKPLPKWIIETGFVIPEPTLEYYLEKNNEFFGNNKRFNFIICSCNHPDFIHSNSNNGRCSYLYCGCNKFNEEKFIIAFNIFERDLFEYDFREFSESERDSFDYFNELASWRRKQNENRE